MNKNEPADAVAMYGDYANPALHIAYLRDLGTKVYSFYSKKDNCYYFRKRYTDPNNANSFQNLYKDIQRTQVVVQKRYGIYLPGLEILSLMIIQNDIRVHPEHDYSNGNWTFGVPLLAERKDGLRVLNTRLKFNETAIQLREAWTKNYYSECPISAVILKALRFIVHPDMERIFLQMLMHRARHDKPALYSLFVVTDKKTRQSYRGTYLECHKGYPDIPWDNLMYSKVGNNLGVNQEVHIHGTDYKVFRVS